MSEQGLTNRLRQRSRRTGLAIALSMALTIMLCIGISAWIYGELEPYVSDFVGASESETPVTEPVAEVVEEDSDSDDSGNAESADDGDGEQVPEATEAADSGGQQGGDAAPTIAAIGTETDFTSSHVSNPSFAVNLRPGPSVSSGEPIGVLEPGTPLEFLEQQGQDEAGSIWLNVRTQGGLTGWIREVDTVPV